VKVVISGIGTGGHYFPALVVAQEFMRRNVPVLFLARQGQREEILAKKAGIPVVCIDPKGFYGKAMHKKIISIVSIVLSIAAVSCITRKAIGLAFGGYGSIPLIIACLINRAPYYLFEPNRISGRATTLFAGKAEGVFLGLPLAKGVSCHSIVTGIPIRSEFKNARAPAVEIKKIKKLLILGGSQGARRLNDMGIALQSLLGKDYEITIISGAHDYERVKELSGARTRVISFTPAPWQEITRADVIISRSGALAGYEIMSSGKPVIFIPFPYAIDDHQYHNARFFARQKNVMVFRETEVDEQVIIESVCSMAQEKICARSMIFDAEQRIADVIMEENN
jgi:UDP-N-acetylglucosamine--N-acetylmuramyl-(pentapeptide) pyrophosphoryl-undecaprenol N-acetylglucosamine transferase